MSPSFVADPFLPTHRSRISFLNRRFQTAICCRWQSNPAFKILGFAAVAGTYIKRGDIMIPNTICIPDKTWTDLDQVQIYQNFMKEYIALLQKRLKKFEVKGNSSSSSYYTCAQPHDRRNPSWQPFKLLTQICKKYDYDPLIAREIIEKRIRKKLECECQILGNRWGNHQ